MVDPRIRFYVLKQPGAIKHACVQENKHLHVFVFLSFFFLHLFIYLQSYNGPSFFFQ